MQVVTPQDVDVVERSCAFDGYFRIDRYRLRHRLYRGGLGPELVREVLERGHAAAVLPYDPLRDAVVLIEQFRPGAFAAGWRPWVLECVAGIIEPGESVEQVVRREAAEEAGCALQELVPIARFLPSQGVSSETVALYCGRVDSSAVGGIHGLSHEGEDILARCYRLKEANRLVERGKIVNATALIALQWLRLESEALRRRWTV